MPDAARCYRLYRPAFPRALLDGLLARARVAPTDKLLDLACGPGRIALALAPSFALVTAVDLSPAMVAEGQEEAAARGIRNVVWHIARVEEFDVAPGAFRLVTIGDAFHRIGHAALLANIRRWLAPGGAVAVLSSHDTLSGAAPWHRPVLDVVAQWTGKDTAALSAPMLPPQMCEDALKAAGFRNVVRFTVAEPYVWSVESILGNLNSTSFCARDVLGPRAAGFADAVRAALAPYAQALDETLTFECTTGEG